MESTRPVSLVALEKSVSHPLNDYQTRARTRDEHPHASVIFEPARNVSFLLNSKCFPFYCSCRTIVHQVYVPHIRLEFSAGLQTNI